MDDDAFFSEVRFADFTDPQQLLEFFQDYIPDPYPSPDIEFIADILSLLREHLKTYNLGTAGDVSRKSMPELKQILTSFSDEAGTLVLKAMLARQRSHRIKLEILEEKKNKPPRAKKKTAKPKPKPAKE
ncbi:MAG: hypothetical protein LBF58_08395 [Deltaproteobacteria bacterium]|jgi:hypothetical protein|nr:hypothetical protein [Deltaproteobacteria bacterium]